MAVAKHSGQYIACPGNFQLNPLGGFLPAHGVPVVLEKQRCKNSAHRMHCSVCGCVMFVTGDFWDRYGLTVEQVRAIFPAGALNGRGVPLW